MSIQIISQTRGWRHLRQRASNLMGQITKKTELLLNNSQSTQQKEAKHNSRRHQNSKIANRAHQTHMYSAETLCLARNNDASGHGSWQKAFEQTQEGLYLWLAKETSSLDHTEEPFEVSSTKSPLELVFFRTRDPNHARNRMGLMVDAELANNSPLSLYETQSDQYTVRTAGSRSSCSNSAHSTRSSASTYHDCLDPRPASPLLRASAGMRIEAMADELLHSLGAGSRVSPVGSEHHGDRGLESRPELAHDPKPCTPFKGFSDLFSFNRANPHESIISSCSPTHIVKRLHVAPTVDEFTFFPEVRQWVQAHASSSSTPAKRQQQGRHRIPQAKCGICKNSNLVIDELQSFHDSSSSSSSSSATDETEAAVVFPCGHMFGKDCLTSWRSASERNSDLFCPTCRASLVFSSCKHVISGLIVGNTADVPLTGPEGGRIPSYCNDCRLSKIQTGCLELSKLIFDDFEATEGEYQRAARHMLPLVVAAAQRATVEPVMRTEGWGNTDLIADNYFYNLDGVMD